MTGVQTCALPIFGPKGRNVVLDKKWGAPTITNDGVSIAKEIELEDPYEKIGAELVKEVAKKTDDVAGDGTTTATVLAQALVREGLRNVAAGANPMALKRGIEKAVEWVVADLKKHLPKAYHELERIRGVLEKHFKDVQDFEFTIQEGVVYMLQTRNGKRTAMAALKFSMDMYKEKLIDWQTAVMRNPADQLDQLLAPVFDASELKSARSEEHTS